MARSFDVSNFTPARLEGVATGARVVGPFTPTQFVANRLTLTGNWAGSVTLLKTSDGSLFSAAVNPFTANVSEFLYVEQDLSISLYLSFDLSAGSAAYVLEQVSGSGVDELARANAIKAMSVGTTALTGVGGTANLARRAAMTATPTLTLSASTSGTRVLPVSSSGTTGVVQATNYSFLGGRNIARPSGSFPASEGVTQLQGPVASMGFGAAVVSFYSDDPAPVFVHQRQTSGEFRVLCDGVEIMAITANVTNGTMQAGSTSTTANLASGASATNDIYNTRWIRIDSGTGAGQIRQIVDYVGSTKIATVSPAWSVTPDATSVYFVSETPFDWTNSHPTISSASFAYITCSWGGEERMRRYDVVCHGQYFVGVNLSKSYSTIAPAPRSSNRQCVWLGDSHSAGTGTAIGRAVNGLAPTACDLLGWELCNISIGGTGYLNPNASGYSQTFKDRVLPPVNAWVVDINGTLTGSFTVTQDGKTVTINATDDNATIQAAFNSAFGSGAFRTTYGSAATQRRYWFIGQGANAAVASPMTLNLTGLSGYNTGNFTPVLSRYQGEILPNLYRDASGNILPFELVVAGGANDTTASNAAYTKAALQTAATELLAGLAAAYPMAKITVIGPLAPKGSVGQSAAVIDARDAILAAATATLPKINGRVPFIDGLSWTSGSGFIGGQTGTGNSDVLCWTDQAHFTTRGHSFVGGRVAQEIQALRQVNA